VAEDDGDVAGAAVETPGQPAHPAAPLALAGGQRLGTRAVATDGAQGGLEHGRGPALDRVAPVGAGLAVGCHQSSIPITNQRAGESFAPTSFRASAPSLHRTALDPTLAPTGSMASSGSPSALPSGVSSCTRTSRQPWKLACFTV